MNIYVGNLSQDVTEEGLRQEFESFGKVSAATIIKDKFSGETRGFGFVEMPTNAEGEAAIKGMNGKEVNGKTLIVNEARPRATPTHGGGGGRGGERRSGGGGGGRRF